MDLKELEYWLNDVELQMKRLQKLKLDLESEISQKEDAILENI